ncbi:MAG: phage baseplate assembly protein V [Enterobacter asburiae]|uniref:phage baseplate assembly protein V n=1 Tax=Enterobacter asburiae TaxID=61645 RepID=UPI001BCB529F|nr:phage baseplate assembly protein V [Enterobacter asburiae]MDU3925748.1 phage baseplate assembly protein V [Enterobacter asburiae]
MGAIQSLQRQVLSLIGRAVVKSINAASKCQTVDVELLAGQGKAGIEHLEPYGFTSRAKSGAEAVVLFPDGDRSHAVVVSISDRRYRIKGLKTGEVAFYDDQGQTVTLTRNGIVIDGGGKVITFKNAPKARFEMDIESTGQIKDLCDSSGLTMAAMRVAYNGHKHNENGNITDAPDTKMEA